MLGIRQTAIPLGGALAALTPAGDRASPPASRRRCSRSPASRSSPRSSARSGCATRRRPSRRPGFDARAADARRAHLAARARLGPVRHGAGRGHRLRRAVPARRARHVARRARRSCSRRSRSPSAVARIAIGAASDRSERRIVPLRHAGLAGAALVALAALLADAPLACSSRCSSLGGAAMSSWNGLAFTAAAEIAGRARAGTAMSLQNTLVSVLGVVASPLFGVARRAHLVPGRVPGHRGRARRRLVGAAPARGRGGAARGGARRERLARVRCRVMSATVDTSDVQSGLEGVVAFATEIAEPDKEGGVAPLPRRRHRGPRRQGPVREGLGPARRRHRSSPACRPPSRGR